MDLRGPFHSREEHGKGRRRSKRREELAPKEKNERSAPMSNSLFTVDHFFLVQKCLNIMDSY